MSYVKRDWEKTGNEVTKEDFKRIENGVETNDKTIAEQGKQINVLSKIINNIETTRKLKTYINLSDLGLTNESTFSEIAAAMPNNSSLEFSSYNPLNWFPASVTGDRNDVEIKRYSGGVDYIKVKLSNVKTGVWHGYYTEQTGLVWEKIATTTKTSFNCIPNAGFTIDAQNCYIQNNKIFINVRVTSDTNLKPNTQIIPVNLPTLKLNTKLSAGSVIGTLSNVWNVTGSCLLVPTSSHVRLVVSSECKSIVFSVEGDLA